MGSGERGKRSVSAERVKNGAGDNGFRWDTSVEAVEFPIRYYHPGGALPEFIIHFMQLDLFEQFSTSAL